MKFLKLKTEAEIGKWCRKDHDGRYVTLEGLYIMEEMHADLGGVVSYYIDKQDNQLRYYSIADAEEHWGIESWMVERYLTKEENPEYFL